MMSNKSRRHHDIATLFHVLLPSLVILQAALCAAQCSFWHALLQYSTHVHALHLLRPPLGQPGHAQRRRSPAPDAPAFEPEEAALVVSPHSAEQAESVSGCGEIDMAEASAKSLFTAHSSLSPPGRHENRQRRLQDCVRIELVPRHQQRLQQQRTGSV
jgi:hypothetical protein